MSKKSILEWIIAIAIGLFLSWLLSTFIFARYTVRGDSMFPSFHNSDQLVVSKISKNINTIHRGDVIIFHANSKEDYIKRLIGIPGDKVQYKNDKLYINNKFIKEPYLKTNKKSKSTKYLTENFNVSDLKFSNKQNTIPKNKYLVLGDNRTVSNDSRRDVGLLSKDKVVGKVIVRIFPLSQFDYKFYPSSFNKVN
ncbi:signal peptidase I [Staphylococcus capitis]|uniref:signal peptidase I n=1 Tax=Staphylococcus capitis TaxID=29388 RepID=UPI003016E70C